MNVNRRLQMGIDEGATSEPWKNLFTSSKMAAKGASLDFVAPLVKDGKKVAQLRNHQWLCMW